MGRRVATATRLGFFEQARRPLLGVLLVTVPFVFITWSFWVTEAIPRVVELPGGGTVPTTMRDIHGAIMGPITVGFLAGLVGLFVVRSALESDRRLVVAGFTPGEAVVPRLAVIAAATVVVLAVSIAVTALDFAPASWWPFVAGNLLAGLTYALIGALAGATMGALGGAYFMVFLPMLDFGIAQNPMFFDGRPPDWAVALPGWGSTRMIVDGAFSAGFEPARGARLGPRAHRRRPPPPQAGGRTAPLAAPSSRRRFFASPPSRERASPFGCLRRPNWTTSRSRPIPRSRSSLARGPSASRHLDVERSGGNPAPCSRATTSPACQPGARPPAGGWIDSLSIPLRVITHAITEFEFHISPVPSSSRPHTGVGTCATTSSKRRARSWSLLSRRGLSTASATSGMCPSRQSRISYRKIRNRPAQRAPTGPSATTPRCLPLQLWTGACSMTNAPSGSWTCSAEW
jgi:hypothetical protein